MVEGIARSAQSAYSILKRTCVMNPRVNTIYRDRKINRTSQTQIDKARRDPENGTPYYYSRMACRPTLVPMKVLYTVYTVYTVTVAMFEAQHDWMHGLHTIVKQ